MYKNILIIAPHADDEVLGCGGIISKFSKKKINVYVAVMTNASVGDSKLFSKSKIKKIRNECLKANKKLGVKKVFFYDFPAPKLDQYPIYKISEKIYTLINIIKCDTIFLPYGDDIHKDHQCIYQASLVACRPKDKSLVKNIFCYETLSETEWGSEGFFPNYFEKLSKSDLKTKISAFKQYKSQIKKQFHPRSESGIKNLARYRGNNISEENAEAFKVIRVISK
ncbi:PIG-L family deacetylase [Candidatus Pelagibacter sp.]|nr:PIG-L family deacetylase [Candidatus Pelagibacter sp.]